jgi:hypothetical protein
MCRKKKPPKYHVVPEICRPSEKFFFGGAAPEPPRRGIRPPLTPMCARRRRSNTTTLAKNITHTQQFLHLQFKIDKSSSFLDQLETNPFQF